MSDQEKADMLAFIVWSFAKHCISLLDEVDERTAAVVERALKKMQRELESSFGLANHRERTGR